MEISCRLRCVWQRMHVSRCGRSWAGCDFCFVCHSETAFHKTPSSRVEQRQAPWATIAVRYRLSWLGDKQLTPEQTNQFDRRLIQRSTIRRPTDRSTIVDTPFCCQHAHYFMFIVLKESKIKKNTKLFSCVSILASTIGDSAMTA